MGGIFEREEMIFSLIGNLFQQVSRCDLAGFIRSKNFFTAVNLFFFNHETILIVLSDSCADPDNFVPDPA